MGVLESRRCSTFRTHFRIRKMKKVEMTSSSHLCIKKKYRSFYREPKTHGVHRERCT